MLRERGIYSCDEAAGFSFPRLYNPDAATSDLAAYVLGLFLRRGSAYITLMWASDLFASVLGQNS